MITLEIPRIPPSPNNLLGAHWRHRAKNSELWRQEVWLALYQSKAVPPAPYPRAQVSIDRRSRGQLDPDNLVGSVKPVIDALRYAKVLLDDSPAHLELKVTQTQHSKLPPRTLIKIQPLNV